MKIFRYRDGLDADPTRGDVVSEDIISRES